jgi:hypothetical protein
MVNEGVIVREWTLERIAALSVEQIRSLRENALRGRDAGVVALCDTVLAERAPIRLRAAAKIAAGPSDGEVVLGFHFVCPREIGVRTNQDGTVWTGTWVVAEEHAKTGVEIGAYVALHVTKSEDSYLQGRIINWDKARREPRYADNQPARTEYGINFLLQLTPDTFQWHGEGSGEKGYLWGPRPDTIAASPER